jgi:hypothetical protein
MAGPLDVVPRTGQPGQAPEQRVIIDYDIDDYKAAKTVNCRAQPSKAARTGACAPDLTIFPACRYILFE